MKNVLNFFLTVYKKQYEFGFLVPYLIGKVSQHTDMCILDMDEKDHSWSHVWSLD